MLYIKTLVEKKVRSTFKLKQIRRDVWRAGQSPLANFRNIEGPVFSEMVGHDARAKQGRLVSEASLATEGEEAAAPGFGQSLSCGHVAAQRGYSRLYVVLDQQPSVTLEGLPLPASRLACPWIRVVIVLIQATRPTDMPPPQFG